MMLNYKSAGKAFPLGFLDGLDTLLNPIKAFPDDVLDQLEGLLTRAPGYTFARFMAEVPAQQSTTVLSFQSSEVEVKGLEGRQRRRRRYLTMGKG